MMCLTKYHVSDKSWIFLPLMFITSPPGWVQCIPINMSVCLSAHIISQKTQVQSSGISILVTYDYCSFFLLWQCNALCTSGFVDDVMFSHDGAESKTTLCLVQFARWQHQSAAALWVCSREVCCPRLVVDNEEVMLYMLILLELLQ